MKIDTSWHNIIHILPSLQFYDSGGLGKCTGTLKEDSLKNKKIQDVVSSNEVIRLFQKYETENGQIIIIDKNLAKDCIWLAINEIKRKQIVC